MEIKAYSKALTGILANGYNLDVYGMCYETQFDGCPIAFSTSWDGTGLSFGVGGVSAAGVTDAFKALDNNNNDDYSVLSVGTASIAGNVQQTIQFNKEIAAGSPFRMKMEVGSSGVSVGVFQNIYVVGYRNGIEVSAKPIGDAVLASVNLSELFGTQGPKEVAFKMNQAVDAVALRLTSLVGVTVLPAVKLYYLVADCTTPMFEAWKSFKVGNDANIKTVKGNEEVEYTIHICNTGNVALEDYIITDALPAHTTYVVGSGGTYDATNKIVTFSAIDVPVGLAYAVTFKVKVDANLTGVTEIKNIALVKSDAADSGTETFPPLATDPNKPDLGADKGTVIPVLPKTDVIAWKGYEIVGKPGATAVSGGEEVIYTIYIKNNGNQDLSGISVSDVIPAGTKYFANSGGVLTGTKVDFTAVAIPFNTTKTLSFSVKVNDDMTGFTAISNVAVVKQGLVQTGTVPPADPLDPANGPKANTPAGTPTLIAVADGPAFVLWKAYKVNADAAITSVKGGEEIEYSIFVRNTGNKGLTNIVISDPIPAGTTLVSGSLPFTTALLPFGATSQAFTFKVKVDKDLTGFDKIHNLATAVSTEVTTPQESFPPINNVSPTEPNTGGPKGTDINVDKINDIDLGLTGKSNNATSTGQAGPDNIITYTITIKNTGNQKLTSLKVNNPLPANTTFNGVGDITPGIELNIPTLEVGETKTYTFQVKVDNIDPTVVTEIVNTVTAKNAVVDKTKIHKMSTTCTPVDAAAIQIDPVTAACANQPLNLSANLSAAALNDGVEASMVVWYADYSSSNGVSQEIGTGLNITVTPTTVGTVKYYAVVQDPSFCFNNPPAEVSVNVIALPSATTISASAAQVCEGETITLTAAATAAAKYHWYKEGTLAELATTTVNTFAVTQSGIYRVVVENAGGCLSPASAAVTILVKPTAQPEDISVSGNVAPVCEGTAVELLASSTLVNPIFKWYANTSDLTTIYTGASFDFVATSTVTYYVGVVAQGVCETVPADRKPVLLTVNAAPVINLNPSVLSLGIGQDAPLPTYTTEAGVTYEWKESEGNTFTGTKFGPYSSPGTYVYSLIATQTASGCQTSASVTVRVFNAGECPPIFDRVYATDASEFRVSLGASMTKATDAADGKLSTHSTLSEPINLLGLAGETYQLLKWTNGEIAAGTPVTIKLGRAFTLVELLGGIHVQAIDASGSEIGQAMAVDGNIANLVSGLNIFEYTFVPIDQDGDAIAYHGVKVSLNAMLGLAQSAQVYEAYYQNETTTNCGDLNEVLDVITGSEKVIAGVGVLNGLVSVVDPENAVDGNDVTYAVLKNDIGATAYSRMEVVYDSPSLIGDTLTIRTTSDGGLLSLDLLKSFTIQPYLGGVAVGAPIYNNTALLQIGLLNGDTQADIKFIADRAFDRIKILYGGVASVFSSLRINEIERSIPILKTGPKGDNKFNICPGEDITIDAPDNCTTYEIYDAATAGAIVDVTSLLPGIHTVYVQTVRFGTCEVGDRVAIEISIVAGQLADIADIKVNGVDPGTGLCILPGTAVKLTTALMPTSTITNPVFHWYDGAGVAVTTGVTGGELNLGSLAPGMYTYSVAVSGDGVCENAASDRKTVTFTINPLGTQADIAEIKVNGVDPGTGLCLLPGTAVKLTTALMPTNLSSILK